MFTEQGTNFNMQLCYWMNLIDYDIGGLVESICVAVTH